MNQGFPQLVYLPFCNEEKIFVHSIPDTFNLLNRTPFLWANNAAFMLIIRVLGQECHAQRGYTVTSVLLMLCTKLSWRYNYI
jgi:hypothetical protein